MRAMKNEYSPWLGSVGAYELYSKAVAACDSPRALAYADPDQDSPATQHRLLQVEGNVGIINIKGSLVSGSAGYMSYYGIVGYDDIRRALAAAVTNPQVGSILLAVDSGGGHVAGVHETAQLIQRIDRKIKPVLTYNAGDMKSAAIWLGSAGRQTFTSATGENGSIGILMMHKDVSKQLADNGVKVTVIRAGVHKAVGNPYEPLTDEAKASMEAMAQACYDIFLPWVAENRGQNAKAADEKYGQGRIFLGKQAVEVGLIDAVGSFEDAYTAAQKLGSARVKRSPAAGVTVQTRYGATNIDPSPRAGAVTAGDLGNNPATPKGTLSMKPYTPEQLALMAQHGIDLPDTGGKSATEKTAEELAAEKLASDAEAARVAAEAEKAKPVAGDAIAALGGLLANANAEVGVLKTKVDATEAKLADSAKLAGQLTAIVRQATTNMGVIFGVAKDRIAAMSETELLAEHARLEVLTKEKFKTGRVSSASADDVVDEPGKKKAEALPLAFVLGTARKTNA